MTAYIETPDGFHDALKLFMEQHDDRKVVDTLKSAIGCYARRNHNESEIVVAQLIMALWGDLVNWGNDKQIADAMSKAYVAEHNTLQQSMMRTFCMMCDCWVKQAQEVGHANADLRGVDARNQDSFDVALGLSEKLFSRI